jgi:uncharacterized protein (UPF0276 family)
MKQGRRHRLRSPHLAEIGRDRPATGFRDPMPRIIWRIAGTPGRRATARRLRLSIHAVGFRSARRRARCEAHLARVAALREAARTRLVSDHLSWSVSGGRYFNDLLPLPYTEEALEVVVRNVGRLQDAVGRQVSIENPSCYLGFADSTLSEPEFLSELARRSGCGLLLDPNNIVVTAHNLRLDPCDWLDGLPGPAITQYHLAGHATNDADGEPILIDDHGSRVSDGVWALFAEVVKRFGARPTLIEWDTDIPPLGVLLDEAARATGVIETVLVAGGQDAVRAA